MVLSQQTVSDAALLKKVQQLPRCTKTQYLVSQPCIQRQTPTAIHSSHANLIGLHQNTHPAKCGETQRREVLTVRGIKSQRQPLKETNDWIGRWHTRAIVALSWLRVCQERKHRFCESSLERWNWAVAFWEVDWLVWEDYLCPGLRCWGKS